MPKRKFWVSRQVLQTQLVTVDVPDKLLNKDGDNPAYDDPLVDEFEEFVTAVVYKLAEDGEWNDITLSSNWEDNDA